jgi:hypothetical protein
MSDRRASLKKVIARWRGLPTSSEDQKVRGESGRTTAKGSYGLSKR